MSYEEPIEVKDKNGLRIELWYDEHPLNPREEWLNCTNIFGFHKRYQIGDEHPYQRNDFNSYGEIRDQLEQDYDILMIKPLYIMDHSQVSVSTSPYRSRWDSGQVGWVFVSQDKVDEMGIENPDEERLEKIIESEVETLDSYINGQVFRYKVTDKQTGEFIDACHGFYDEADALDQAKGIVERELEKRREARQEKLKALIENDVPFQTREKVLAEMDGGS